MVFRTTPYNPRGNGQCERINATIWNTISLALASRNLPLSAWEDVLPECLHAIRSLLCTATNCTPHERMFSFERRSPSGSSLPTWLTESKNVLLKRYVRGSKYEPGVDLVELMDLNTSHAVVRFPDGHEDTVSLRNLAPYPYDSTMGLPAQDSHFTREANKSSTNTDVELQSDSRKPLPSQSLISENRSDLTDHQDFDTSPSIVRDHYNHGDIPPEPRRSSRISKPVQRLNL